MPSWERSSSLRQEERLALPLILSSSMEWTRGLIRSCVIISVLVLGVWGAEKCPNVAFIIHSNNANDVVSSFMAETFLRNTNLIIVSGHDSYEATVASRRNLRTRKVVYDGNPGGMGKTFRTGGRKYLGTHRTMAGILIAMDTIPDLDWVYVLDDDNVVNVDKVCNVLGKQNSSIPLLLGFIGPKHGHAPCRDTSSPSQWTCCKDTSKPCLANISSPFQSAHFQYNSSTKTMSPIDCNDPSARCCEVVSWPEGISHGFPFRLRQKGDVDAPTTFSTSSIQLWPYGGSTYALSKSMLQAVGRDNWERFMYRLQCDNADINVMNAVLNTGYSIHEFDKVFDSKFALHHVHDIAQQFNALPLTQQPKDVFEAACNYKNIEKIVGPSAYDRVCARYRGKSNDIVSNILSKINN